uniref:MICOS complex subunit MIC10 n=1 Tax=Panagrellus redivivus TaxID=6233 RepID=A0A7E4ZVS9_PANRE
MSSLDGSTWLHGRVSPQSVVFGKCKMLIDVMSWIRSGKLTFFSLVIGAAGLCARKVGYTGAFMIFSHQGVSCSMFLRF